MPPKSQNNKIKKLVKSVEDCHISTPALDTATEEIEFDEQIDPDLLASWPDPRMKVPTVFLHKTVDFAKHAEELLKQGANFYKPYLGTNYTRIICRSMDDHKTMLQYFLRNKLPFHTFGDPNKRKIKVIIRPLPNNTDLNKLRDALKAANIPIIRIHKMHMKDFAKGRDILVLAVVPFSDEGKKILQVKKVFGINVKIEPPNRKTRQCHRCQKWGHSQRYCYGDVKCVKCAGDHLTSKCKRDATKEPPTCANCGGNHTASYRECFYCPDSLVYKQNQRRKINRATATTRQERELVTSDNIKQLYKKIKNIPKHNEAVPF